MQNNPLPTQSIFKLKDNSNVLMKTNFFQSNDSIFTQFLILAPSTLITLINHSKVTRACILIFTYRSASICIYMYT